MSDCQKFNLDSPRCAWQVTDFAGGTNCKHCFCVLSVFESHFMCNVCSCSFAVDYLLCERSLSLPPRRVALVERVVRPHHCLAQYAVWILTTAWGLRLSLYLLMRILKIGMILRKFDLWSRVVSLLNLFAGEDKRFDDKRNSCLKFGAFWVFQGGKGVKRSTCGNLKCLVQ